MRTEYSEAPGVNRARQQPVCKVIMLAIKRLVRLHPAAAYFACTFAISWGGLIAIGGLHGITAEAWQADPRLPLFFVAMLAGPSVAGVLLTAIVFGSSGFAEMRVRLMKWRVHWIWYVFALLPAPIVFLLVEFALGTKSSSFLPALVTNGSTRSALAGAAAVALIVGLFEEIGWTGFAAPVIRARHATVTTGLIVGVPWGAWHLLTNNIWIARAYAGDLSPVTFAVLNGLGLLIGQLPAYRVLMVLVYERTGSLFVAMLMHASLSACTFVLGPGPLTGVAFLGYSFVLSAAWWLVVAAVVGVMHPADERTGSAAALHHA